MGSLVPSVLDRHGGILLEPDGHRWKGLVEASWGRARSNPAALALRAQLGLPVDRPVVMSGHQALLWHPGILAKWYAVRSAAEAMGAAAAWVVVDHDTDDPTVVQYPSSRAGILTRAAWRWCPGPGANVAVCAVAACSPQAPADCFAGAGAFEPALEQALRALRRGAGEKTLARQVVAATAELAGGEAPLLVYSSELLSRPACGEILASLSNEPDACVNAYNQAAGRHPEAGLRWLVGDDINDRWELPLWRLGQSGVRERVFAEELGAVSPERLAPRAIFMTGLLRSLACDLFIHGLGGGVYDVAGEAWWSTWRPQDRLASTAVVSATLHLKEGALGSGGGGYAADSGDRAARVIDRARWLAHHAAHNPGATGDVQGQARKLELVANIRGLKKKSSERREAFARLRGMLTEHTERAAASLRVLRERAADAEEAGKAAADPLARDWPFFLYPQQELDRMESAIAGQLGSSSVSSSSSTDGP